MDSLVSLFAGQPLLLLFLVVAVGYPFGRYRIAGFSLGVASVLFSGIAFGSIDESLRLPDIIPLFGLVLFVYTIGLESGPAFVDSIQREGLRDNFIALGVLVAASIMTLLLGSLLGLAPTFTAGLFAGSLTNTPALAALVENATATLTADAAHVAISEAVVAYSVAYPLGVINVMLAIVLVERYFKIDYAAEAQKVKGFIGGDPVDVRILKVTFPSVSAFTIGDWCRARGWRVMFGRVKRGGDFFAPGQEDRLESGDLATVVGPASVLDTVVSTLGEESIEHIEREGGALSMRRLFVSSSKVVGLPIGALDLHGKFGAVVTRVRRGDADMPISGKTILRLGDRVRVVAPHPKMKDVAQYFGDSYRAASEIDILTFSLGLTLGLLAGLLPLPIPGEAEVHLGAAGGPLVVGLLLGALTRTKGMVWSIPYGANLTLRQLGLTLFLAGVGTKAGFGFVTMVTSAGGLGLLAAGGGITFITAMTTLLIGRRFGIDGSSLVGMTAGIHTQPAVLGFANERAGNDLPNVGYASVYPVATVSKIVLAQLLMAGGFVL